MSNLKVNTIEEATSSAGVTISSDLTVSGATFTSRGIDDNATAEKIDITDGTTAIANALTVAGTFTSQGIDDNATSEKLDITNTTTTVANDFAVSGTFTSQGIDDNATSEKLDITDSTTTIANNVVLNGTLNVAGGYASTPYVLAWWRGSVTSSGGSEPTSVADVSSSVSVTSSIASEQLELIVPDATATANPCVIVTCQEVTKVVSATPAGGVTTIVIDFPGIGASATHVVHVVVFAGG